MAYSKEIWEKAKGLYEVGYTPQQIADELGFTSRDTVSKRAKKENWDKNKILQTKTELVGLEKENSTIRAKNSTMVEKLAKLEDYQVTILKDVVEDEIGNKSLLFSTANLSLIRKNQLLTKNKKTVVEIETFYNDDGKPIKKTPVEIEIELSPVDLKTLDEGIDKNAVTLEVGARHANQQINVNTQTNVQQKVQERKFDDFYE